MRMRILLRAVVGALALAAAGTAAACDGASVLAGANALRARVGVRPLTGVARPGAAAGANWLVESGGTVTAAEVMAGWPELLAWLLDPRTTLETVAPHGLAQGAPALAHIAEPLAQLVGTPEFQAI